jgi:hypothetical protein
MCVQEYRQQYAGEDTPELRKFILSSTTKAIASFRASFIHAHTKARITISPDDLFKQMTEHIVLLPDEADTWMLSLAETYYCALTPAMQSDMTRHDFKMLFNHYSASKKEQVQALNEVRSHAIQSHERKFQNSIDIKEHVQAAFASSGIMAGVNTNSASVATTNTTSYENFTSDPSMHILTDDEINTFSYDGNNVSNDINSQQTANTYNFRSQTEQTYSNCIEQQGSRTQDESGIPPLFVQQFEMKQGIKYPTHPNHQHCTSEFPVGHRGCYKQGGQHIFQSCPRKDEPGALKSMQFNMHYH